MKYFMPAFFCLALANPLYAQQQKDSTIFLGKKTITLSEVVVDHQLNVPVFIERIKKDTSFYKAFRNLHIIGFTAINDIRMNNSDGEAIATLHSTTQQLRNGNCRTMLTKDEQTTGDFFDADHNYNYYTAQMYASLFFTKDSVCGEDNIVAGRSFSTSGKSGMEKHKEQLKMLFFNPGRKINGLPFMSNKTAIFDDDIADRYDMNIDYEMHDGINCYVFKQTAKAESKNDVVVDEMTTWFDQNTYEVVARNYSISYDAGVYDFKVTMEVTMTHAGNLLVPSLIRYNGNWKAIFKPRERGVFTATLSDFK